jgi:hypothetical protein
MYYYLSAEITIGGKKFSRVNSVEIETDMRRLEDIATIKLPTTARLVRDGEMISEVETARTFAVGDEVSIKLGYDGELREEFHGFVRKIRPNTPLEIECEDAVFLLKRKPLKRSFKNTTLKELLNYILADTGISLAGEPPGVNFTHFYLRDNISAAKALQKLKEEYGLTIYFKSFKSLFVGIASDDDGKTVKYRFGENVIDNDLEWTDEADVKMRVKAIHVKANNTQVKKEVGDPDGELRTIYLYDLEKESDLERLALEELKKQTYSGYRGTFKTFLLPVVRVGNIASITDPNFPERAGSYLVEKVKVTYDEGGARRIVSPSFKIS